MIISYLTSTTPSNNIPIPNRSLHNHDGVVQTSLHLRDELLGSPPQDEGARFGLRAAFEEIEALAADLALLETFAGAEVVVLDVGAGAGDGAAAGLDDALEVVGRDAAGAEDVAVCEVSDGERLVEERGRSCSNDKDERRKAYCVARSPIGNLLNTTLAPVACNASILL